MDWVDLNTSNPTKEREGDMSSLVVGFGARMRKRAASAQGETTTDFEIYGGKCLKRSSPSQMKRLRRA